MLKKNKGYFLAELLLTLSAWLVIAGVMVPLIMKTMNHSIATKQENTAVKVLYETLLNAKKEGRIPLFETVSMNQTDYEVVYEQSNGQAIMEVCVQYENVLKRTIKKCEFF